VKAKILISLAGLTSFGFSTSVSACSITVPQRERAATPEENEQRARREAASEAETRLHADVVVVGYLSEFTAIVSESKDETPVHVYGFVFPQKVLRGITEKNYSITRPRPPCQGWSAPHNQLIQLYLNKQKTGWTVVAYDKLSE
jgi:hypothetical protein